MTDGSFMFDTSGMQRAESEATQHLMRAVSGLSSTVDDFEAAIEIYKENIAKTLDRQFTTIHQRNAWQTKALVGARAGAISLYDFQQGSDIVRKLLKQCHEVSSKIDLQGIGNAQKEFARLFPFAKDIRDSAVHIVDENSTPEKSSRNTYQGNPQMAGLTVACIASGNRYMFTRRGHAPGEVNEISYAVTDESVEQLRACLKLWWDIFAPADPLKSAKKAWRERWIETWGEPPP